MSRISDTQFAEALRYLSNNEVIVFPTDTVYGIGCRTDAEQAIETIYTLKGRSAEQPLQILLSSAEQVPLFARQLSSTMKKILDRFWPGGLTVLLPAQPGLPIPLVGSGRKVGLRIPAIPDLQRLIRQAGGSLAASSANRSGEKSPLAVESIPVEIKQGVRYVLDIGPLDSVTHSTVIDGTGETPRIIREAAVSLQQLAPFGVKD